nr:hypothetical protein [uncultured bacterium]
MIEFPPSLFNEITPDGCQRSKRQKSKLGFTLAASVSKHSGDQARRAARSHSLLRLFPHSAHGVGRDVPVEPGGPRNGGTGSASQRRFIEG